MIGGHLEAGCNTRFAGSRPDQACIGAFSKGQFQTVEQNGFSRTSFTCECCESGMERQIQRFDENDVAYGKKVQHYESPLRPVSAWKLGM